MAATQLAELIKKYFPPEEWERAYKVAMGESGGKPGAVGDKYPIKGLLAPSYGYFQIRGLPGRPAKEQLLNPEFNVKYAAQMQKAQGWKPWTVARKLGYADGGVKLASAGGQMPQVTATTGTQKETFDYNNPEHRRRLMEWRDQEIAKNPKSINDIEDYYEDFLKQKKEEVEQTKTETAQETTKKYVEKYGKLPPKEAVEAGMTAEEIPEVLSEEEKKKKVSLQSAGVIITELEDKYFGGKDLAAGRLGGVGKMLLGKAGLYPELSTYKNALQTLRPKLARAMGDVGNLSEPEQRAAIASLPKEFSTPEEAIESFRMMRLMMGLPERNIAPQAESLGKGQLRLAGETYTPRTIQAFESAQQKPWTTQEQLPAAIGGPLAGIVASPRYRQEIAPAGLELEALLGLGGLAKSGIGKLTNLFKGGNLVKTAEEARTLASAVADESGQVIKNKKLAEKMIEKVNSSKTYLPQTKEKLIAYIKANLSKGSMTPSESVGEFASAEAYTKGGQALKTIQGKYNLLFRDAVKEVWAKEFPELLSSTGQLSKALKISGGLKKMAWPLAIGIPSSISSLLLYKLLSRREK